MPPWSSQEGYWDRIGIGMSPEPTRMEENLNLNHPARARAIVGGRNSFPTLQGSLQDVASQERAPRITGSDRSRICRGMAPGRPQADRASMSRMDIMSQPATMSTTMVTTVTMQRNPRSSNTAAFAAQRQPDLHPPGPPLGMAPVSEDQRKSLNF